MEELTLKAEIRKELGKKVKNLRKAGFLPAVLYGHDIKPLNLMVNQKEFQKIYQKAGTSTLVDLKIDNQSKKVLILDVQYQPVSDKPLHIDFYQVKRLKKIETEIPLKFIGEAEAVKELDGTLITNKDKIEVRCLPEDLVHEIEVDISSLKTFEDQIKISDLKIPPKIEVLDNPEEVVALVEPPKTEEELAELEAPVEERVEEVEEVKPPEEEEEVVEEKPAEVPEKVPESQSEQK